jgi:hypothetical protein
LIQIQSGRQQPTSDLKVEPRACHDPLDVPCIYHKGVRGTRSVAVGCRGRSIGSATSRALHKLPRLRTAVSSRRHGSASPPTPEIYPTGCPGGLNERPTAGRRNGFRGSMSDPGQCKPRPATGGGAAPGGTTCARDLCLEFEEVGLPTFNSHQGQPGRSVGTSSAGQSLTRGRSSHGARPDSHCSGGGEERDIQIGYMYIELALT